MSSRLGCPKAKTLPLRQHSRLFLVLALAALWPLGLTLAGESRFELRDGSVLSGELVGLTDGGYVVRSAVMGEVRLREADVLSIKPAGSDGNDSPVGLGQSPDQGAALAKIQQQLLGDPTALAAITDLSNDPELKAALADPQFIQWVTSGNVAALSQDPRFQRLLAHPGIQAIMGRVSPP